jgi:RND family efflux transporter MFP subunit
MNSRRIVLGIIALVAVSAILFLVVRGRDGETETAIAQRGSIDVTIQTVGTIQVPNAPIVRASIGGVIAELGTSAGDRVTAGDILAVLDLEPLERAVTDAENQLVQAEFALQLAEYRASQNPVDRSLQFEVLAAGERVSRAERAVADAERARRSAVIVAPVDGTVIEVQVRRGDAVGQNQPVARIATPNDMRLVADVDELDLPNVSPGAVVRIRLDAYPATELEGQVLSTAPIARQQGGTTVFATTVTFAVPDDLDVRPGMNADVTIVTDARDDILLIPERALRTVGNRSYVEVDAGTEIIEREVTLGYRGQGQVEVVAGLSDGERVVLR